MWKTFCDIVLIAGSVTTWGDPACGGNSSHVAAHLKSRAFQICYNEWVPWMQQDGFEESDGSVYLQTKAFTAFREGGQLVCLLVASLFHLAKSLWDFFFRPEDEFCSSVAPAGWGDADAGGAPGDVASSLTSGVVKVCNDLSTSKNIRCHAIQLPFDRQFQSEKVHWCIMFLSFECLSNMELEGTSESLVWHQLLEKVQ